MLQILNKSCASVKNMQQLSDPLPIIVRQMQTSGKQKAAGSSHSSTPPPFYSKRTVWLWLATLLGGGAYVIYKNGVLQDGNEFIHHRKRKYSMLYTAILTFSEAKTLQYFENSGIQAYSIEFL